VLTRPNNSIYFAEKAIAVQAKDPTKAEIIFRLEFAEQLFTWGKAQYAYDHVLKHVNDTPKSSRGFLLAGHILYADGNIKDSVSMYEHAKHIAEYYGQHDVLPHIVRSLNQVYSDIGIDDVVELPKQPEPIAPPTLP